MTLFNLAVYKPTAIRPLQPYLSEPRAITRRSRWTSRACSSWGRRSPTTPMTRTKQSPRWRPSRQRWARRTRRPWIMATGVPRRWRRAPSGLSNPTARRGVSPITSGGRSASRRSPTRRHRTPALRSPWPTSSQRRWAKRSTVLPCPHMDGRARAGHYHGGARLPSILVARRGSRRRRVAPGLPGFQSQALPYPVPGLLRRSQPMSTARRDDPQPCPAPSPTSITRDHRRNAPPRQRLPVMQTSASFSPTDC